LKRAESGGARPVAGGFVAWLPVNALQLLPLVALPWTTCEDGMPWPVYLVFLGTLLRSKVIEFRILRRLGAGFVAFFFMLVGCFEHFGSPMKHSQHKLMCVTMTDKFAACFRGVGSGRCGIPASRNVALSRWDGPASDLHLV